MLFLSPSLEKQYEQAGIMQAVAAYVSSLLAHHWLYASLATASISYMTLRNTCESADLARVFPVIHTYS
jgi:hypothetical protein